MGRKLSFTGIAAGGGGGGGGGGGSSAYTTHLASKKFKPDSGWNYSDSYYSFGRQLGGGRGNQFYFNGYESNGSTNQTRHKFHMFDINRTTGAISAETTDHIWTNNSGAGYSTCWYHTNLDGSGCAGGNICWPGYGGHEFGYDYWQSYSNNVTGTYDRSYDSHNDNGTYVSLTGENAGETRILMSGYYQQNNPWGQSNRTAYRQYSSSGSAGSYGSMGGRQFPSNPRTSTSNPACFFPQISNTTSQAYVHQGGTGLVHANMMPYSTTGWQVHCVAGNGSESDYLHGTSPTQGPPTGIQMQDGTVWWRWSSNSGPYYNSTSYSSHTEVDATPGLNNFRRSTYNVTWTGLGGDYWLTGFHSSRAVQWGIPMGIVKLVKGNIAAGGGGTLKTSFQPSLETYGSAADRQQAIFPLHSNSTDQYPDKLVVLSKGSGEFFVEVSELPASSEWAT